MPISRLSSPDFSQFIRLQETGLEILLVRDSFRTLRLIVKPDCTVIVKAPAHIGIKTVHAFIASRTGWIKAKQDFFRSHRAAPVLFCEGAEIWCLGTSYAIKQVPLVRNARPRLCENSLELPCRPPSGSDGCTEACLKRAFLSWRQGFAAAFFAQRLKLLEEKAQEILGDDASAASLAVRPLKRRWGSCSSYGKITLATALIALPEDLVDIDIFHELCHLRHMDHGRKFHATLSRLVGNERQLDAKLRIWALEHPRI